MGLSKDEIAHYYRAKITCPACYRQTLRHMIRVHLKTLHCLKSRKQRDATFKRDRDTFIIDFTEY